MKAVIIGGGVAGLTAARAFLDAGLEVEVYEKRSQEGMLSGPGGLMIQKNALRVLDILATESKDVSLKENVVSKGGLIQAGGFSSSKGTPLYKNNPAFVGEEDLGVSISRSKLQDALYTALPQGTVVSGKAFRGFAAQTSGVEIEFDDGSKTTADILVGADGIHSKVRASIVGVDRLPEADYSGAACWRGIMDLKDVEGGEAWFREATKDVSWQEYWGRGSRFGWFHAGSGTLSWYCFSNEPQGGKDPPSGAKAVVEEIVKDYGKPIPQLVAGLQNKDIYRDDISDRPPLQGTWGAGSVTLIGDAAHPFLPSLGQGACMAIEDAFELAKALREARLGATDGVVSQSKISEVLRKVEASRSERVQKVYDVARDVHKAGQEESWFGCKLRNLIYYLLPVWLADKQFKWLFDFRPTWGEEVQKIPVAAQLVAEE